MLIRVPIETIGLVTVWVGVLFFGVISPQHYSEESILSTTIDDRIFGGHWETYQHLSSAYFDEAQYTSLTQRERLEYLVGTANATVAALNAVGLQAFIDAGSLLGWYRHDGKPIPWDIDVDIGILGDECRSKFPDQSVLEAKLRAVIDPRYAVDFFSCDVVPDQEFAGVIGDTQTGMKADVFAYNEVDTSTDSISWRKGKSWLQRDQDRNYTQKVKPRESILPLKWGNFSGVTGYIIPNNPKQMLQWDYSYDLDIHLFPLWLALKVSMSTFSALGVFALLLLAHSPVFLASTIASILLLGSGLRVLALILCAVFIPGARRGKTGRPLSLLWTPFRIILALSLVADLLPYAPILFVNTMEALGVRAYTVNQDRYCLFYKLICIDQ